MGNEIFQWEFSVKTFDCDLNRFMRPSAQMKWQQEVGEMHLNQVGHSYGSLHDLGMVFVLTGTASRVFRPPVLGEQLVLTTWSRGSIGSQFFRCYDFHSTDGTLLVSSTSAFALVQAETHRLLRPSAFEGKSKLSHLPERLNHSGMPEKLGSLGEMPQVGSAAVLYSHVDLNRHMNNAAYADLLCDYMPGGMPAGSFLSAFQIHFARGGNLGELLRIYAAPHEDGMLWKGEHDRGLAFTAKTRLECGRFQALCP